MHIFLGFDFYGAGNIGDDLMLAGLLTLVPEEIQLTCVIPRPPGALSQRFPRIQWIQGAESQRREAIRVCDLWMGVGATPFSAVHRAWLLRHTDQDLRWCSLYKKPAVMIGVDADPALLTSKYGDLAQRVLNRLHTVMTRDQNSVAVIQELHPETTVMLWPGIDLANFYLSQLYPLPTNASERGGVGVCYWEEKMTRAHGRCLRRSMQILQQQDENIVLFANEVRRPFEYEVYRKAIPFWERWWGGRRFAFHCPDHQGDTVASLIRHYGNYRVVVSSRYHALLVAAWLGQCPIAIGNRPKVATLAGDLGVPLLCSPWDIEEFVEAISEAQPRRGAVQTLYDARGEACRHRLLDLFEEL